MSVLDDTFTFFTKKPKAGYVWTIDATLTGTKLPSLPAFVATTRYDGGGSNVQYNAGTPSVSPATISFNATFKYQLSPTKNPPPIPVTLYDKISGVGYTMTIILPWTNLVTVTANVDATSGVVYGSEGSQFVTLVLKAGSAPGPQPPK